MAGIWATSLFHVVGGDRKALENHGHVTAIDAIFVILLIVLGSRPLLLGRHAPDLGPPSHPTLAWLLHRTVC